MLDALVAGLSWDEESLKYGSGQRKLVAQWMFESGAVPREMRRLYPIAYQRKIVADYVTIRVWEKIVGESIESNSRQWNWKNLWNPLERTSFTGWVGQLSLSIAKWNGRRVLIGKAVNASGLEEEDGRPSQYDALTVTDIHGRTPGSSVRDFDPTLTYPRPYGPERWWYMDHMCLSRDKTWVVDRLRDAGWWDRSLAAIPPDRAAGLLLGYLDRGGQDALMHDPRVLALADTEETRDLPALYARQQGMRRVRDDSRLKDLIVLRARLDGTTEWHVISTLGSAAAALIA